MGDVVWIKLDEWVRCYARVQGRGMEYTIS